MTSFGTGKAAASEDTTSTGQSLRAQIALWTFCFACTLNGRTVTAYEKDKYDAFFFAHVASRWVHGGIPYLEIWDNKPPGIYIL
ncbi:MAG: hypothetical protein ABSD20_11810, partial [Terriglobales bacterium]